MTDVVKKPKFVPVETDTETLKQVVKEVFSEITSEQDEQKRREGRVNKILFQGKLESGKEGANTIGVSPLLGSLPSTQAAALGISPEKHEHKHEHGHDDCPSCSTGLKKLGDGIEICPDCKTIVTKPEAEFYICANCGSPVPKSFLGTDKSCPACGSNKVHKTLHKK